MVSVLDFLTFIRLVLSRSQVLGTSPGCLCDKKGGMDNIAVYIVTAPCRTGLLHDVLSTLKPKLVFSGQSVVV